MQEASTAGANAVTAASVISLRRITVHNVGDVCDLSHTLSAQQRNFVADNGRSIAEAHYSENGWFRAIYADETLVGFVMLHLGPDHDDGIDHPGAFLWRFMIGGAYQGLGFGRRVIAKLVDEYLRPRGHRELYTSFGQGDGSAEPFYRKIGFVLTGEMLGDEAEALLAFEPRVG